MEPSGIPLIQRSQTPARSAAGFRVALPGLGLPPSVLSICGISRGLWAGDLWLFLPLAAWRVPLERTGDRTEEEGSEEAIPAPLAGVGARVAAGPMGFLQFSKTLHYSG